MRRQLNFVILGLITVLTVFSVLVVWPGYPARYLPDFISYPEGPIIQIGDRDAMRLGLDLKGGTYVLTEADVSVLPEGTDVDSAMDGAKEIIERRVNAFGVAETEVTREGKNRLAIQLPGVSPEEASDLIGRTALLAFKEPRIDEAGMIVCRDAEGEEFTVGVEPGGVSEVTTEDGRNVARCFGPEGELGEVIWEPATGTDSAGETRALTGRMLRAGSARTDIIPGTGPIVELVFTGEGSLIFEQVTGRLVGTPQGYPLGIFLDDDLINAPRVQARISGGQTIITGLTLSEAQTLAIQLNAGALPVPLQTLQTTEVDATLGERTLIRAVQAGMVGVIVIMAFMILYYRAPGVLASMALITYIATVMMIFKLGPVFGPVTITLAGIAGFVLSVGMAVDANILVFERMREELRSGRSLAASIEHGFDRAWNSIRDSNVSTLITCGILWWFGDQFNAALVQGFAITLGIGVIISMFSAIVVTRTLLRVAVRTPLGQNIKLFAPDVESSPEARVRERKPFVFDFVKRRALYFALSAVILIPGAISLLVPPALEPGIEFSSGATFTIEFEDPDVTQADVEQAFRDVGNPEARVQRTSDGNFIIRITALEAGAGPPVGVAPPSDRDVLEEQLEAQLGPFTTLNFNQVSEIVSREIVRNAAIAMGAAAIAILLFVSYSFRNVPKAYRYGIAAIVAAAHDALFIVGLFSILGKVGGVEVNSMFITGVLTVIGFSVHDTIVVFDRIRENVTLNPDAEFDDIANASLTETMARSLNTSTTFLFAVVALLLMSGGAITVLLLALMLGVIAGTYSSIFVAVQILVAWENGDFARFFQRLIPGRSPEPAPEAT